MKAKFTTIIIAALIISTTFFAIDSYTFPTGITGRTNKDGGAGCSCHSSTPNSSVQVSIDGPSTLAPGASATYTVSISGGPAVKAGVNIAASSGALLLIQNQGLQLLSGELTHSAPKDFVQGSVTYNFNYVAPSQTGTATIFATSNSVNGADGNQGDAWNHAPNKVVTISSTSRASEIENRSSGFILEQNYPNPFNPTTIIPFTLREQGTVVLEIFDITGKKIATLVNERRPAGRYGVPFSASEYGLSSGSYLYRLTVNGAQEVRQLTVLK
ncbi:MAG: choice-of-anchor V domain-containing protein [Chloroherpetonaceae bacterium]|nr:choice-of-anchor V domain-containing protein [Chloroherpetonaceae bacterium]